MADCTPNDIKWVKENLPWKDVNTTGGIRFTQDKTFERIKFSANWPLIERKQFYHVKQLALQEVEREDGSDYIVFEVHTAYPEYLVDIFGFLRARAKWVTFYFLLKKT